MSEPFIWTYNCVHPDRNGTYGFVQEQPAHWPVAAISRAKVFTKSFQWRTGGATDRWPGMVWLLEVDSTHALLIGLKDGGEDTAGRPHTVHLQFALTTQPVTPAAIRQALASSAWRDAWSDDSPDVAPIMAGWPSTGRVSSLVKLTDQPSAYTYNAPTQRAEKRAGQMPRWTTLLGLAAGLAMGYGAGRLHAALNAPAQPSQGDCQQLVSEICEGRGQTLDMSHQVTLAWIRCATKPLLRKTAQPPPGNVKQAIRQVNACLRQLPDDAQPTPR